MGRRSNAQIRVERLEQERADRDAQAKADREKYACEHPVREDLTPAVERLFGAKVALSKMSERKSLFGQSPLPLLKAAHEATEQAVMDELAEAALVSGTPGIRVPMSPGSDWHIAIHNPDPILDHEHGFNCACHSEDP